MTTPEPGTTQFVGRDGQPHHSVPAIVAVDPPPANGTRTPPADVARGRMLARLSHSWAERLITYVLLTVMAGADAFGFWKTLTGILQTGTTMILFFVLALAAGSVGAAHEVGKWARSRWEGHGGSHLWIALLAVGWLALGVTLAWIRLRNGGGFSGFSDEGDVTAADTEHAKQIALLFLLVYVLTGALAMSNAFRFGDPRARELRLARRRLAAMHRDAARLAAERRLAEGNLAVRQEDRQRDETQFDREQQLQDPWNTQLRTTARHANAGYQRDPAATDAVMDPLPTHTTRQGPEDSPMPMPVPAPIS